MDWRWRASRLALALALALVMTVMGGIWAARRAAATSATAMGAPTAFTIPSGPLPAYIAAVGDSITAGMQADAPSIEPYWQYIAADAGQAGYWEGWGHSGATSAQLADDVERGPAALTGLGTTAGIVVVQSGENDLHLLDDGTLPTSLAQFQTAEARLLGDVTTLLAPDRGARLVCVGVYYDLTSENSLGLTAADYDGVIRADCQASGGVLVDTSSVYLDPSAHNAPPADTYHPNAYGQRAIASLIERALEA